MDRFETFISQLKETNIRLDSFVDFNKICRNIDDVKIHLNQLNYLLREEDFEEGVRRLWRSNSMVFSVLNILIAVRDNRPVVNRNNEVCRLQDFFSSADKVIEYIEDTGLKEIFRTKQITNLVDYVFGVEVGLDTNARKNRGGKIMEKEIASIFRSNGIDFDREVNSTKFKELACLGEDLKRFDFVVKSENKTYLIEVNFYNGGGSKLNEVARSYSDIAPKINGLDGYEFVWITDGIGWLSAKNKLQEAFEHIPRIYNLTSIEEFIDLIKAEI